MLMYAEAVLSSATALTRKCSLPVFVTLVVAMPDESVQASAGVSCRSSEPIVLNSTGWFGTGWPASLRRVAETVIGSPSDGATSEALIVRVIVGGRDQVSVVDV